MELDLGDVSSVDAVLHRLDLARQISDPCCGEPHRLDIGQREAGDLGGEVGANFGELRSKH